METVMVDKKKLEKLLALYSEHYGAFNIRICDFCPLDGTECTPEKTVDAKCGVAILEDIRVCKDSIDAKHEVAK